ncbi:MAG: hypothetical protein RLZZ292_3914, partial [Bacteroidota bacterium]
MNTTKISSYLKNLENKFGDIRV